MDLYDKIRSRFFKERKPNMTFRDDWLNDLETPFFLNSNCSSFKFVDMNHLTEAMGIDVTAYSFRKIVSTWALSHASEDIRNAEEEALQHTLKVAKESYMQNKQMKPQTLTQKYIEEEDLFPKTFRDEIDRTELREKSIITETEEKRQKCDMKPS